VFRKYLSQTNPNPWYDEPYHSSLLEIACQMKNRKQFVRLLLEKGADPNIKNRVTGMPLIHATARSGNFEVLRLLLEKEGIDTSLKDKEKGQYSIGWPV
jgi:ankyrin repeat protein